MKHTRHTAKFEVTGKPCEVIAAYFAGKDGRELRYLLLADSRSLQRVSQGRYVTLENEVVISEDPEAP